MPAALIRTISPIRFDTYMRAAGHDVDRALRLYLWNARLGASFHLPIQSVEVALRNRVNEALKMTFGPDWWREPRFRGHLDLERLRDLEMVERRLRHKKVALVTDQIVASLSFGFWIGMLHKRYNPTIWSRAYTTVFTDVPAHQTRQDLFERAGQIARVRNRISHHEPLIKIDALRTYRECLELLEWLCPATAAWIRPFCEVPRVVREKP